MGSVSQGIGFMQIHNITMDGIMDELLAPENTNVTFELTYASTKDPLHRYVRSAIDFTSTHETIKKILPAILEDLCFVYGVPTKLAT